MIPLQLRVVVVELWIYNYDYITFTSNDALNGSVTGGPGKPLSPVVNPEGGGARSPRETKSLLY